MTRIDAFTLDDDGTFPNNRLPVLLYPQAFTPEAGDPCATLEALFRSNGWGGTWRNGIFDYHHYHATAHEVLGCARGWVRVLLGGPKGREVRLEAGDVVLLPAGTAHRNMEHSTDYRIVGAYPAGQHPDMKYGEPGEYAAAKEAISRVSLPQKDPVSRSSGGVLQEWR
jgi:uncharacterized protein YjlB